MDGFGPARFYERYEFNRRRAIEIESEYIDHICGDL